MKTLKALAFLLLSSLPALGQINLSNQEPTIVFGMTNAFGRPDTNYFRVIPIQNPVLANGTIITRGIAIRMYPDTNGITYTNFAMGWFQMSNQFLGQGIIFEVPNDTNSYWAGSLARSGFNTYEMTGVLGITSSNGTVAISPANGVGIVDLATTGQGSGSVTSIGLSMPSEFSVAGSPVTTAGIISVTKSTESANTVYAGPSSGGALAPTFRALAASDIPAVPPSGAAGGDLFGTYPNPSVNFTAPTNFANGIVSNGVVAHTVTVAGTANQISSSVGTAQQLANNPATTLSLPSPTIFPGQISVVGITNSQGGSRRLPLYDNNTNLISLANSTEGFPLVSGTGNTTAPYYSNQVPYAVTPTIATLTNLDYSSNIISPVLTWPGPSNAVTVYHGFSDWFYASATPVSLTNCVGSIAGYNLTMDLCISNSSAATFTNFCTIPNATYVGQNGNNQATNELTIASGKQGYWHVETRGVNRTNVYSTVEQ